MAPPIALHERPSICDKAHRQFAREIFMARPAALPHWLPLLLFAGLFALLAPASAGAAVSSCSIANASITFGPYDSVTKAQVDSVGTFTLTCSGTGNKDTVTVELSGGNSNSCTTPRRMLRGSNILYYQLYDDSTRSTAWCSGSAAISVPVSLKTSTTYQVSIYGRVFATQTPTAAGTYSDSLTATVRKGGTIYGTTPVAVSGSVSATCAVSSGNLAFGTYSAASASTSTANLSINCSNTTPYTIALSGGLNADASSRRLASGTNYLPYLLYRDSGRTLLWGNGTMFGSTVSGTGTGSAQTVPVYGRIAAGQYVRPGAYSDTVVVTVTY